MLPKIQNTTQQRVRTLHITLLLVVYVFILLTSSVAMQCTIQTDVERSIETGRSARASTVRDITAAVLSENEWQAKHGNVNTPIEAKAIYVSSWIAGDRKAFQDRVELIDNTPLNAMVIDLKDASGKVVYNISDDTMAKNWGLVDERIDNIEEVLNTLAERDIYSIARLVVYKDPQLVKTKPEWFLQTKDGSVWRDYGGKTWLDPYNHDWWDYIIEICIDAAKKGFDEIQFDYVRFPTDGPTKQIAYSATGFKARTDAIGAFLDYAREQLKPYDVFISADVFGLVTSHLQDMSIGQNLEKIAEKVDYVCPMIYPSHYYANSYGIDDPESHPYEVVLRALLDAKARLNEEGQDVMRPWLQDFTIHHPYGKDEVLAQIRAVQDAGYKEWILWDPRCRYTRNALYELEQ